MCFIPKCSLFVPFCSNRQNRYFRPSGEAPPKLLLAWRASAGQAFADRLANSERRILDPRLTCFIPNRRQSCTDPLFLKSRKSRGCQGCAPLKSAEVLQSTLRPCTIRTLRGNRFVDTQTQTQVGVNVYAKPKPPPVRNGGSKPVIATSLHF